MFALVWMIGPTVYFMGVFPGKLVSLFCTINAKNPIVRGLLVDNLPPPRDFMRQVFFFLLGYHMVLSDKKKFAQKKLQVKELLPLKGY